MTSTLLTLALGAALALSNRDPRGRLAIGAVVFALWTRLPGAPISVPHAWALFTVLVSPVPAASKGLSRALTVVVTLLTALQIVTLVVSPHPSIGISPIADTLSLVILLRLSRTINPIEFLPLLLRALSPVAVVQAVSTVVFYFSPVLEEAYLRSPLAHLFIGPRASFLFTTMPDNVTLDGKAGGLLFSNGNTASMVMACWGLLYLARYAHSGRRLCFFIGILCMVGEWCTGSKTAWTLTILIPPMILLTTLTLRIRTKIWGPVLALNLVGPGLLAARAVYLSLGTLSTDSATATRSRDVLFAEARKVIEGSPWFGVGYGGWQDHWYDASSGSGLSETLPPHNFLLYLWTQVGVLGPLLVVLCYVMSLAVKAQATLLEIEPRQGLARVLEMFALVWVAVHGLYDTSQWYGSMSVLPVFAALLIGTPVHKMELSRQERQDVIHVR